MCRWGCSWPTRLTRNTIDIDFKNEQLQDLITTLIREGFQPYLTSVGGSGLGILSPYPEHRVGGSQNTIHASEEFGQVTPPDTPTPQELVPQIVGGVENGSTDLDPLRGPFVSKTAAELPEWAGDLGRWLYV